MLTPLRCANSGRTKAAKRRTNGVAALNNTKTSNTPLAGADDGRTVLWLIQKTKNHVLEFSIVFLEQYRVPTIGQSNVALVLGAKL